MYVLFSCVPWPFIRRRWNFAIHLDNAVLLPQANFEAVVQLINFSATYINKFSTLSTYNINSIFQQLLLAKKKQSFYFIL